jgi:hypothetical protein
MLKTAVAALAILSIGYPPGQASAQGLFDFLFGRPAAAPAAPPVSQPVEASPSPAIPLQRSEPSGPAGYRSASYCVRLCDGRFFPLQRHRGVMPAQLCSAHCPAAQTRVFSGSEIGRSIASDGTRYARLENAFAYRERIVPDCTCNGASHFGLARITIPADPTLRPGDIVVTAHGTVVAGKSATEPATLTPAGDDRGRSGDIRHALASHQPARLSQ